MNSYFNHSRSCLAAGLPKAGPRALLLNTCHPWGLEGRALSATGQGHTTLQVERCKQGQLPERGALSYHSLQFSFLWQSQASEMTSESAGYFKAQSSNSPPNNIFNVDVFKIGFLILSKRLTCCDRRVRGFGGSSESLTPAQLSACILHNHAHLGQGLRHGKEPQEGFLSITTPVAPLCHRELGRTPASKVLRYSETLLVLGWIHKADPSIFLEVFFIQNAY